VIEEQGDLWELRVNEEHTWINHHDHWLVIFTNLGWKQNGAAVMGKGLALEAAKRVPTLPWVYGEWLRSYWEEWNDHRMLEDVLYFDFPNRLILMPTKTLVPTAPERSWNQLSSIGLIYKGLLRLQRTNFLYKVYMGLPGCGHGGLKEEEVLPHCQRLLDDRFHVVVRRS
jgi:hypothetical protein